MFLLLFLEVTKFDRILFFGLESCVCRVCVCLISIVRVSAVIIGNV